MPAQIEPGGQLPIYPYYNYVIAPREETRQVRTEERRDERVELEMRPDQPPAPDGSAPSGTTARPVEETDREPDQEPQQENKQEKEEDRARHVDSYA